MRNTKDREKRQSIIDACRSMNALGINQGTSGNISLRHGEELLITPTSTPYHGCLQIGTPRLLPKAEIENVLGRIAGYGPADK